MSRVFQVEVLRVCGRAILNVEVDEARVVDGVKIPAGTAEEAMLKAVRALAGKPVEAAALFDKMQRNATGEIVVEYMPDSATLLETEAMKAARMARASKDVAERSTPL